MFGNCGFVYLLVLCTLQQSMGRQVHMLKWHGHDDPVKHIQGVTYEKLHHVFQSYPVDRRNMAGDGIWVQIRKNCEDLVNDTEERHVDTVFLRGYDQIFVKKKKVCHSVLLNCQKMKATYFCPSDDPERRYDFAQLIYEKGGIYGRNYRKSCTVERYFKPQFVNPCLCECESPVREVDRYFSLRDVVADEDKVVTGIRIRKDNHVFHIQIKQGTLGPNLTIIGEAQWKDTENISTSDLLSDNISKDKYTEAWEKISEFYKNDLVYAITAEQNTVLLDILKAGPGRVVTGLRFRQIGNHLRLEIKATPYFTKSGELQTLASQWIASDTIDKSKRKPVILEKAGIPSAHNRTTSFCADNQYIRFQPSDFKEDVGQTTVPFVDVQDVVADPPSPLLGAALAHRANNESAGFITLRAAYDDIINY